MDGSAALIHGLSNLNLLEAQATPDPLARPSQSEIQAAALAGLDDVLNTLREVIGWPVLYAEQAAALGVRWPRGVLLHGPSGTGKSSAVAVIAAEFNAVVHLITAGSVVGAYMGESERRLREIFAKAHADAARGCPVVIFLDDVDSLCPRRGPGAQHEARLVGQLLTLLDGAGSSSAAPSASKFKGTGGGGGPGRGGTPAGHVAVIAATSRPNALDPALRRPGRLDREVAVGVPQPEARTAILKALVARIPGIALESLDLARVAAQCHGYTGADLEALCREATLAAMAREQQHRNETSSGVQPLSAEPTASGSGTRGGSRRIELTTEDLLGATKRVGASLARSVVREFPPAKWEDVGGLEDTKRRLRQAVEWPISRADAFKRLGIRAPRGVLLHGPPGCAKTTLARAAATSSGATFIPLQGASLYSMYVGEGEAELRTAFQKARLAAPAIVFVDELDMLVGKRGAAGGGSTSDVSARLLSTFLNEMDGLDTAGGSSDNSGSGVLVLATTNRPQSVDSALLRPGRFDVTLYVPPPDRQGRLEALKVHSRRFPLAADVDLAAVAQATERYTGAELAAVCREAAMAALREDVAAAAEVSGRHFEAALKGVRPALGEEELRAYAAWPPRK